MSTPAITVKQNAATGAFIALSAPILGAITGDHNDRLLSVTASDVCVTDDPDDYWRD